MLIKLVLSLKCLSNYAFNGSELLSQFVDIKKCKTLIISMRFLLGI